MKNTITTILLLVTLATRLHAQEKHEPDMDAATYAKIVAVSASCIDMDLAALDTMVRVAWVHSSYGRTFSISRFAWPKASEKAGEKTFVDISGRTFSVPEAKIVAVKSFELNQALADSLKVEIGANWLDMAHNYGYFAALWFHLKGRPDLARQLFTSARSAGFDEQRIVDGLALIYYDEMLSAYTHERNYKRAARIGALLNKPVFKTYKYQKTALDLAVQLKNRPGDYQSLSLPDSASWSVIAAQQSRTERIHYLVERLCLLNCVQSGQPAWISYNDVQHAIPITELHPMEISFWDNKDSFVVINPYTELLRMRPDSKEVLELLPYLSDSSYIPTYSYHRDFFSERTLHRLRWVVNELIFDI
ncbi:MAG: hypothetical protein EOP49_45370, partial [Sphingobacteriales bacterium]